MDLLQPFSKIIRFLCPIFQLYSIKKRLKMCCWSVLLVQSDATSLQTVACLWDPCKVATLLDASLAWSCDLWILAGRIPGFRMVLLLLHLPSGVALWFCCSSLYFCCYTISR
jgi:hypothetical protein